MEKIINPTSKVLDIIFKEIKEYETGSETLGNKTYSQSQTINTIVTHQNGGFLMPWNGEGIDPRESYDIGSPIIATRVVNTDLDTKDFEPVIDNPDYRSGEYVAKSVFRRFINKTNQGEKINNQIEEGHDIGNLVVRKVNNSNSSGEIYTPVMLTNLYVIDTTARTLEDTVVIEKQVMNQTTLRKMKEWSNIDKVIALGNLSKSEALPSYLAFYRYGEISRADYNYIQKELTGKEYKLNKDDQKEYIQSQIVVVKAKKGKVYDGITNESEGIVVFAEELQPEVIKISEELEIIKYKPYSEFHLGAYKGRWLREGAREVLIPYQNNANSIKNRFNELLEQASLYIYWSKDQKLATKNILSSVRRGQVIGTEHLELLNNTFPNLTLFANEWNSNIRDAERALKAFEVASGENLPSSTSATAVSVQNIQVGKYYDFIREKFGLFFSEVYNRWVIPTLMGKISLAEKIEIIGDPSFIDEYAEMMAKGQINKSLFDIAVNNGSMSKEQYEQLVALKKQEILKDKKQFLDLEKEYLKGAQAYVTFNPTGELFNKQARISNGLLLLQYISNPAVMNDPQSRDIVINIANDLGYKIKPSTQQLPVMTNQSQPNSNKSLPMKEQPIEQPNPNVL